MPFRFESWHRVVLATWVGVIDKQDEDSELFVRFYSPGQVSEQIPVKLSSKQLFLKYGLRRRGLGEAEGSSRGGLLWTRSELELSN